MTHEDDGRDREEEERRPPAEEYGEQAAEQRPDDLADVVGDPVAVVRPHPVLGRVVVGEQRVVGRVVDGLAERRSRRGRSPGCSTAGARPVSEREDRPHARRRRAPCGRADRGRRR